jgi:hypothetical protein
MVSASLRLALVLFGFVAAPAIAAPINYGDFTGTTVMYLQVTEAALTTGDTEPLFGAPNGGNAILGSDTLDFNPTAFSANASGADGNDKTDGQLTMMIRALDGNIIDQLLFQEAGDFDLTGLGIENDAFASVKASFFIDIIEVDGVGINQINLAPIQMVFTPSNGDWTLLGDGGPPQVAGTWTGSTLIDITQALVDADEPFVNGATKVNVSLNNRLTALSATGTDAFIAKKDADGLTITVTPEPGGGLLLALGLAALAARHRRI